MNKDNGFTLIELIIAVAILAILASIAYPSYVEQVRKSKRADAKTALYKIAQQQEEYFIQHLSYAKDLATLNNSPGNNTIDSPKGEYSVMITTITPTNCTSDSGIGQIPCTAYSVTATAKLGKGQYGDKVCRTMTLDNLNRETSANDSGTATTVCW